MAPCHVFVNQGVFNVRLWVTDERGAYDLDVVQVTVVRPPPAPKLWVTRTTTNTVAVSWPSPSTGWTLQQNTNSVSSVNWSNVTATIQDDGTTKTLIVNPPAGIGSIGCINLEQEGSPP